MQAGGGGGEVGRKMGLGARLWAIRLTGTVHLWVLPLDPGWL